MIRILCGRCANLPGRRRTFPVMAEPVGYPNAAALICRTPGCTEPALIWLSGLEATEYRKGQRLIFRISDASFKVRAKSPPSSLRLPSGTAKEETGSGGKPPGRKASHTVGALQVVVRIGLRSSSAPQSGCLGFTLDSRCLRIDAVAGARILLQPPQ